MSLPHVRIANGDDDVFFFFYSSSVLTRILNRVRKWEDLGKMRSFVKQTEIKLGLDESYRELRTCSMRFNVRPSALLSLSFLFLLRGLCH